MANNECWYCRKGGIVDLYLAGRTGICPKCGRGVNIIFDIHHALMCEDILTAVKDWAESVPSKNEPLTMEQLKALPDGTKVYCYQIKDGKLAPDPYKVCRTKRGDKVYRDGEFHYSFENVAVDGSRNSSNRRVFLHEVDFEVVEATEFSEDELPF